MAVCFEPTVLLRRHLRLFVEDNYNLVRWWPDRKLMMHCAGKTRGVGWKCCGWGRTCPMFVLCGRIWHYKKTFLVPVVNIWRKWNERRVCDLLYLHYFCTTELLKKCQLLCIGQERPDLLNSLTQMLCKHGFYINDNSHLLFSAEKHGSLKLWERQFSRGAIKRGLTWFRTGNKTTVCV